MMRGYYHSRETFGTVDGKGIRYVLFLAGCSLSCVFCHNPDTWQRGGKSITVEEVMADVLKYQHYYKASGGGITVSGGEPLLQPEFVAALFQECRKQGIHTTLDTAGFCPQDNLEQVLPYTDEVLFCLKVMDEKKHRLLTGADNRCIQSNLRLAAAQVPTVIRYVVIPEINDESADIQQLAAFIVSLPQTVSVELLGYHIMGKRKWEDLGIPYRLSSVPPANQKHLEAVYHWLAKKEIDVQPMQ